MTEVQNLKRALNNFHNNHLNIRVSIGPSGSSRLTQIYFCLVDMWGWTFHYTVGGTNKILASLKYNVLIGSLADGCAWYRVWWDPNCSSHSNHLNPACDLWPNVFRCASVSKNHVLRISDYYESLMSSRFCHLLSDIASHCLIYSANIVHIVNFVNIVNTRQHWYQEISEYTIKMWIAQIVKICKKCQMSSVQI